MAGTENNVKAPKEAGTPQNNTRTRKRPGNGRILGINTASLTAKVKNLQLGEKIPGLINKIKESPLLNRDPEVSQEEQDHLKNEFLVYVSTKKALITDPEQLQDFDKQVEKFLKRMDGRAQDHWGDDRYFRLLEKWFSDYDQVISGKIKSVKSSINSVLIQTNDTIQKLVLTIQTAISEANKDGAKAQHLLSKASLYAAEAGVKKEAAGKVLDEYGKEQKETVLGQYDLLIVQYQTLITSLQQNIEGVKSDTESFNSVIGELQAQSTSIANFSTTINAIQDVQSLIQVSNVEFVSLRADVGKVIEKAQQIGRKTGAVDAVQAEQEMESSSDKVKLVDGEVEGIKQAEVKRREEEKKRKEEERKRKEEEARKQREAEEAKLKKEAEEKASTQKGQKNNTATPASGQTFDADVVKTRGGKDYTKELWNASSFATESKAKIDESNYTKEEKAFFEHYKNSADAYLKSWYKQQGDPKQQLTADMYVNAAKRVFKKYGHLSYVVPVELALIQGRLESKLGMTGASAYTNPYNVGEYDGGARSWVKDITTAEMGIFAYMDLMAHDYLSDKTADQLLEKQGESFVNEENSRYASAPRYEMEIKAMMGQVMLVADGKRTKKPVGKGKNNATKDGEFVRTLLKSAGYTDKDLGTAILKFQSEVMYPPLTAKQKRYVTKMNSNDLKSHNDKEATGKDGIASTKANTLGLLYYMYKKTSAKTEKVSADSWDITKDNLWQAYSDFKNDKINMIAFAKACAPHGGTHGHDINLIVDKLGFTTRDNFAIALMNHTSDSLLAQFDSELLQNLHDNLGTYWLTNATKSKMYEEARERINKLLGGKTDEGATAKKESEVKKSGKRAREIISYDKIPENYRKQFAISESVGPKKWGKNKKADVEIVQQLLKLNGYELSIDGGIGVLTLNCIFHFQKIEGLTGDTKIGTSGNTLKRLVEKAYFNGAYDEKEGEIDKAKASELNAARKGKISDVPASLVANVIDGHLIGIDNSDYLLPKPLHADAKRLKTALETIKKDVGDFTISCGYRSPEHNVGIGSTASKSQHVFGIAADIHSPAGYTPKTLKSAIEKLISNGDIPEGGIGTYYWGCHYDIRGTKARWGS